MLHLRSNSGGQKLHFCQWPAPYYYSILMECLITCSYYTCSFKIIVGQKSPYPATMYTLAHFSGTSTLQYPAQYPWMKTALGHSTAIPQPYLT